MPKDWARIGERSMTRAEIKARYRAKPGTKAHEAQYQREYLARPDVKERKCAQDNERKRKHRQSEKGRRYHAMRERLRKYDCETREYVTTLLGDPCCYCGTEVEAVDHIDAISVGGGNDWDNLTSACQTCNSRKSNKSLLAFLGEQRGGMSYR